MKNHATRPPINRPATRVPTATPATAPPPSPLELCCVPDVAVSAGLVPDACAAVIVAVILARDPRVGASVMASSVPQQVEFWSLQHHVLLLAVPSHGVIRMLSLVSVANA